MKVNSSLSFEEKLDTTLISNISLSGTIICALYCLYTVPAGFFAYSILNGVTAFLCLLAYFFSKRQKFQPLFWLFFLVVPTVILGYIYFFGLLNSELYLIAIALIVTYLSQRTKYANEFIWAFTAILFLLAKYFLVAHERLQEMTELESALYYPNTVAAIYLIYVSSKLFRDRHIEQKNILKVGNEQKERLITVLTHDLRSPFNSLKGLLSMVSSNDIDQKQFQEFIPKIAKEVELSSLMIDNLLYWIKGQMNGVKPEYNYINIQQIIDENKVFLDSNLKEKNILFVVKNELALTECNVLVDKEMMSAVIRNLLTNAIKFCKPNAGRIEVVISKGINKKISLKIADNGRGMNEKQLSGLFENNHLSNVGTTNEKGFGLGLLLVKSFADEMNIEIKVESQLNQGTAFYMQIPT